MTHFEYLRIHSIKVGRNYMYKLVDDQCVSSLISIAPPSPVKINSLKSIRLPYLGYLAKVLYFLYKWLKRKCRISIILKGCDITMQLCQCMNEFVFSKKYAKDFRH